MEKEKNKIKQDRRNGEQLEESVSSLIEAICSGMAEHREEEKGRERK